MQDRSLPDPLTGVPFLATLLASLPAAQEIRLNGTLPSPRGGDLLEYHLVADGQSVVYLADQEVDQQNELFLVTKEVGGLVHRKLNAALVVGGDVQRELRLAPDESRVVYVADQEVDERFELYSVALAGGAPVKLSGTLPANLDVSADATSVRITSDSTRALFLVGGPSRRELFLAPLDGSQAPLRISTTLGANQTVHDFLLSRDGTRAVYRLGSTTSFGTRGLFSAVLDGSRAPVQLDTLVGPNGAVADFRISADGTRVLFRADATFDENFELLSAAIDGGPSVALSRLTQHKAILRFDEIGNRVVFEAPPRNSARVALYSAPLDGSSDPVQVSPVDESVVAFKGSPDGTRVAFASEGPSGSGSDLHVVPVDGSAPAVQVNPPLVALGTVYGGFRFSPDSSRLVYQAIQDTYPVLELYSAPADASAPPVKLNPPMPSGAQVAFDFDFAASHSVVFKADASSPGTIELWSAPILGGSVLRLNGPLVFGGDVATESFMYPDGAYRVSQDGNVVVYLADELEDGVLELFHASPLGAFPNTRLNLDLPIGPIEGDVNVARLTPDGKLAVYLADQVENDVFELFAAETERTPAPRRLNGTLVPGGDVEAFLVSPDGTRAAYVADELSDGVSELFVVRLDGSSPSQRLNLPLAAAGTVLTDFQFTPDGAGIVFKQRDDAGLPTHLWSVRADGSAPPVRLSVSLHPAGGIASLSTSPDVTLTPDGLAVVFQGDFETQNVIELWVAPVDGSSPPTKLNTALQPEGDVLFHRLSPSGDHVLYLADANINRQAELFGVPLDASSAAVELDGPLSVSGLPDYSPDEAEVVFIGSLPGSAHQLVAVPRDASAAARSLAPNAPSGTTFQDLAVVPASGRVLFRADPRGGANFGLYSVALDGSLPVRVSKLGPGSSVRGPAFTDVAYRATSDGLLAAFTAMTSRGLDLYVARVDGVGTTTRISLPALEAQDVRADFRLDSRGVTVLYRQAPAAGQPIELFRAFLAGGSPVRVGGGAHQAVADFVLSKDGRRVLTRETSAPNVLELFTTALPPAR